MRFPTHANVGCPHGCPCSCCVVGRRFGLTRQEIVVVGLICAALATSDIATVLLISEETVKRHLSTIFNKLGVDNRTALAMMALRHGIVRLELAQAVNA